MTLFTFQQPESGYRFAADSVALVEFVAERCNYTDCLDLCAGCGVVGQLLLAKNAVPQVTAVEIQGELAALAETNAAANGVSDRYVIHNADICTFRDGDAEKNFRNIVCNPPFYSASGGRLPPDSGKAIARHELKMHIGDVFDSARFYLHRGRGRLFVVYTPLRLGILLHEGALRGFGLRTIQPVHGKSAENAEFVLLEFVSNRKVETQMLFARTLS